MKFKVGDKVKILPDAIKSGVNTCDVGKVGFINNADSQGCLSIRLVPPASRKFWYINGMDNQIVLILKEPTQLLFAFMEED